MTCDGGQGSAQQPPQLLLNKCGQALLGFLEQQAMNVAFIAADSGQQASHGYGLVMVMVIWLWLALWLWL